MVWMLDFAQQEGKRRGGHTWRVLVAGEEPDADLAKGRMGTWGRAAALAPVVAARKKATRDRAG
jgi:hypothetical protein